MLRNVVVTVETVVPWLLAAVPPVLIVLTIVHAGTRVPMEDHWDMVPLLAREATGTLTAGDLWAQQNEHRYVIPWLLMLGLARLTRWSIVAELMLNVAVSLAAVALLVGLVARTCRARAPALVPWLALGVSLLTFSLVKWENWLWGLSLPAFTSALAACATVAALAWRGPTPSGAVLAMLAATAGALSFANGLVLLALVPAGLALDPRAPRAARRRLAVATAVFGVAIAAVYLAGLRHPAKHPSPFLFLSDPAGFAGYVLVYLGAPLGWPSPGWSLAWGVVGLVAFAGASSWLWRRLPDARAQLVPWLLLALDVVASGAMVGIGRLGMGRSQAMASRYTTISTMFWTVAIVVVALAVVSVLDGPARSRRTRLAVLATAVAVLVAAAGSYASVWVRAERMMQALATAHARMLECVRFYRQAPDACLRMAYHDPAVLRQRAEVLERLGLGPFASPAPPPLASYTRVDAPRPAGAITNAWAAPIVVRYVLGTARAYESLEIGVAGWAIDPGTLRSPRAVLVAADGVVLGVAPVRTTDAEHVAGWAFSFDAFRLPAGARILEAYAVLDGGRVARLAGAPNVERVRR